MEAPKYIKQLIPNIKELINTNTIMEGYLNTPLTPKDRLSKQENQQGTNGFKWHTGPDGLKIFRTFHPKIAEYTFFSSGHGTSSRIDHILGHKTSLNKFKKNSKSYHAFFSDHSTLKLDVNHRKKSGKTTNTWD